MKNGQLMMKGSMKNQLPHLDIGKHITKMRQLWEEVMYKNGKQNGRYVSFYENGQLEKEGIAKNDKADGRFRLVSQKRTALC